MLGCKTRNTKETRVRRQACEQVSWGKNNSLRRRDLNWALRGLGSPASYKSVPVCSEPTLALIECAGVCKPTWPSQLSPSLQGPASSRDEDGAARLRRERPALLSLGSHRRHPGNTPHSGSRVHFANFPASAEAGSASPASEPPASAGRYCLCWGLISAAQTPAQRALPRIGGSGTWCTFHSGLPSCCCCYVTTLFIVFSVLKELK